MAIIEVNDLTKEYRLGQLINLKQGLESFWARLLGNSRPARLTFKALDNINFTVKQGEVLGIIGSNGAGKSTLLKLLSRITRPTKGRITVAGSVAPLIEVGAGIHPELTGQENIYLNASILGISRDVVRDRFDEIVDFAELDGFIDTPMKRYSSGMRVRLAFSVAIMVNSDILIVDEVLAVGDLAFQRKCFDRMEDLINRKEKTVLLVSHNIRQVQRICSRVILLDKGKILADGETKDICNLYYEQSDAKIKRHAVKSDDSFQRRFRTSGEVALLSIFMVNVGGEKTEQIKYGDDITVTIRFRANVPLVSPIFAVGVHTTDFLYLSTHRSEGHLNCSNLPPGEHQVQCHIKRFPILPGVYSIRMSISGGDLPRTLFYAENLLHFQVEGRDISRSMTESEGFFVFDANWHLTT